VELIVALLIVALVSTAICAMTFGAMNGDRYLRFAYNTQSEIELASRRIVNNIHEAQTGSIVLATNSLTTVTQADVAHGYSSGATIVYSLQPDATTSTQNDLVENDPRYGGNNVLVHNVTTFTVAAVNNVSGLYQVDIVAGSPNVVERHFKVFTRN
jgi:type II secretory pathway pseudopilin PulG